MSSSSGDVSAAFHYTITLAPNQTLALTSTLTEPRGLGGLALFARPRRRAVVAAKR